MTSNEEAGRRGHDAPAPKPNDQQPQTTPNIPEVQAKRHRLPNRRASAIIAFEHAGQRFRASGSYYSDGRLAELFLDSGKATSTVQEYADNCAVLTSLALQHDVPVEFIRHSITGPVAIALDLLGGAR